MARVFDCFMFFDEFDALTIRLHELASVVDHFVLIEASTTFSGSPKPFHFSQRADEFRDFTDKIINVQVADLPTFENRWIAEHVQRNAVLRGLTGAAPDDIVVISDCDEIPRASAVGALPEMLTAPGDLIALEMPAYYYALNLRSPERVTVARATRRATLDFVTPQELRTMFTVKKLPRAGWHFSYLAPKAERIAKIARKAVAFAHEEYDLPRLTNDAHLSAALANDELWWKSGGPFADQALLHRVPIDESFPDFVRADPARWRDHVVEGAGDPGYELKYRWEKLKRDLRKGMRLLRSATRTPK